ncbi:MAG: lipopolysaccharide biosynthesis protein [Thiohalocapsa sp.]
MLRDIGRLATASGLGQIITIAAAPVLTRLYSLDGYGVLGVFMSCVGILSVVACLRYELAIPLASGAASVHALVKLCVLLLSGTSVLLLFAVALLGQGGIAAFGAGGLGELSWLLPLGVFVTGLYQVLSYVAVRDKGFGVMARTKVSQSGGAVLTQGLMGIFGTGATGLLFGQVMGTTIGAVTLGRWMQGRRGQPRLKTEETSLLWLAQRYRRFPVFSAPAGLLNALALNVPVLLIANLYGEASAGAFFLAQRILNIPLALLATSISQVYMAEAARQRRERPEESIAPLFWSLALRAFLVGTPLAAVLWFLAPTLFPIVFGNAWVQAGVFASLTAPLLLSRFVTTSLAATLTVLERQHLTLILQTGIVAAALGSLWGAGQAALTPEEAVGVYGMVTAAVYGFFFLVLAKVVKQA